ncbi:MAG: hypothetical protein R3Y53_03255 [Bacillota bacterium]
MTTTTYIEEILPAYEAYFDITTPFSTETHTYTAQAAFHSRSEKYMLMKAAKIWAMENHEYIYFAEKEQWTFTEYETLKAETLAHGLSQVKPHSEHMYTYVTLVIVGEDLPEELVRDLEKTKFHKTFLFSLRGWCDFRLCGVDIKNQKLYTNKKGKELKVPLQKPFETKA